MKENEKKKKERLARKKSNEKHFEMMKWVVKFIDENKSNWERRRKEEILERMQQEEIDELIDWNVYLNPLTNQLWGVILMKCFIFTMIIYVIEWLHGYKLVGSYLILKSFYKLNKRIK